MKIGTLFKSVGAGLLVLSAYMGCLTAASAEVNTNVEIKEYMPEIKTVFVDDDFNNQTGDTPAVSEYDYPVQKYAAQNIAVINDGENTYLQLNGNDGFLYPIEKNVIDSDRLTISFDVKSNGDTAPAIEIGRGQWNETYHAVFSAFNVWGSGDPLSGQAELYTGELYASTPDKVNSRIFPVEKNTWINVTMTFERSEQEDGSYASAMTECIVDGTKIDLYNITGVVSARADWWTSPNGRAGTLSLRAPKVGTYIDNLIIYEPVENQGTGEEPGEEPGDERVVTKPPYMPEISRLFADDGFENRPVDQRANTAPLTAISYPVNIGYDNGQGTLYTDNGWGHYVRQDESGNKYLEMDGHWRGGPLLTGYADADELAVSFSIGYKEGSTSTVNGSVYIGDRAPIAFQLYSASSIKFFYEMSDMDASESSTALKYLTASDWHKVSMVFRRELDQEGAYKVYLKNLYLDDSEITNLPAAPWEGIDWWSEDNELLFRLRCKEPYCRFDDILVYEPAGTSSLPVLSGEPPVVSGNPVIGGSLSASASVTNTGDKDQAVMISLAIYRKSEEGDILQNVKTKTVTVPAGADGMTVATDALALENLSEDSTYYVKAFLWSDVFPLCRSSVYQQP